MAKRISRRTFILAGIGSLIGAYVGGWWLMSGRRHDCTSIISAIIRKKLPYLHIDDSELARFAQDVQERLDSELRKKLSRFGLLAPLYSIVNLSAIMPQELRNYEERLARKFLMSSDFFRKGARTDQPVRYLVYYDPYELACANPFAQFS